MNLGLIDGGKHKFSEFALNAADNTLGNDLAGQFESP